MASLRLLTALVPLLLAATLLHAGNAGKAPIPAAASQVKARKLIFEVFQDDLRKATAPADRAKLAAEWLQQGREIKDDLTLRYTLLLEASDLAAAAGEPVLALTAIDELSKTFAIDALAGKAKVLHAAVTVAVTKESANAVLELTVPLIADALDVDHYDAARQLAEVAEAAARKMKNPNLVLSAKTRLSEIEAAEKAFARQQGYLDRVKADPSDAEANFELGKYYGLIKRHWDRALPYLARGSEPTLKTLAERDRAGPREPQPQLALADAWWDYAVSQPEPARLALQARAAFWYGKSVGRLAGLSRTKAQKRLEQVTDRLQGATSPAAAPVRVGELKKLDGHFDEIKAVAFAPDGQRLASGGLDNTLRIWDLASGKLDKSLPGHTKQIWAVAFHPNQRQVFSASWDATVRLWDLQTGAEVQRYTHPIDVNGLALARDGATFLSACDDKQAYLWNTVTGDRIRNYDGATGLVYSVAFAPDGKHLATGGVDRVVRIYELATGQLVRTCEPQSNAITVVAFTQDSKHVLSAGDNVIHLWEVASGKEARRLEGHVGSVPALALSPDRKRAVTGGEDRTIRLWDLASGKELYQFKGHTDTVNCLAYAPDGRRIASGGLDKTVRVWGLPR